MNIPFGLSKVRLCVYAGIAIAFASVLTFAGCEHSNAEAARAERDSAEIARDTAVDANAGNLVTIETQRRALEEWRALRVTPEEAALAIAAHHALVDKVLEQAAELEKAKESDRARPDCEALLDADFERVCPATARGLRKYESRDQDRDGRGSGAGGEAAADRAHR
jgi:hypothetical protein